MLGGVLKEEGGSGGRGSALPGGGFSGGSPEVITIRPGGGFRARGGTCPFTLLDGSNELGENLAATAPAPTDEVSCSELWKISDPMREFPSKDEAFL